MRGAPVRRRGPGDVPVFVDTLETPSLGDRTYLVHDGDVCVVIDPQRDIDRVLDRAAHLGVRIGLVLETHLHNDYVTGGLALAVAAGAIYGVPAGAGADFEHRAVDGGDEIPVGAFRVRAVHTPGHTHHHLSYVFTDRGKPMAVCSGGSMLYGTVGRTDLVSSEATEGLTRDQHRSVRSLGFDLDAAVSVHPTHGFGSFCSSGPSADRAQSTIGQERADNMALTIDDEDRFVEALLRGLTAHPRYYAHMAPLNRQGPARADLSPAPTIGPAGIRSRIEAGEWVVDLRRRDRYAADHAVGTLNIGLSDSFVTYLGWTIPWGTPVTLLGETEDEIAGAQRMMARIGIDRPAGCAAGGIRAWGSGLERNRYRSASFADLRSARDDVVVLDVRRIDEWQQGHLAGAVHIPFDEVDRRIDEVPEAEVWVHCGSGYRAALSASMLVRAGRRRVVLIDDDWSSAVDDGGLEVVRP